MSGAEWQKTWETIQLFANTLDRSELAVRLLEYVCALAGAEEGVLAVKDGEGRGYRVYRYPEDNRGGRLALSLAEILPRAFTFEGGKLEQSLLVEEGPHHLDGGLIIPLRAAGSFIGAVFLPARISEWESPKYCLLLLACCCGALALEAARIVERAEHRLQEKLAEIHVTNLMLREQHRFWQHCLDFYQRITQMVLGNHGMEAIGEMLYQAVGRPIAIGDETGQVILQVAWPAHQAVVPISQISQDDPAAFRHLLERKPTYVSLSSLQKQFVVPLAAGEELLGHLYVFLERGLLDSFEQMVLENAALAVSLELLKERIARETELQLRSDFLKKILSGTDLPPSQLEREVRRLGLRLDPSYRVLVIRPLGLGADKPNEAGGLLAEGLKTIKERLKEFGFQGFVVEDTESFLVVIAPEREGWRAQLENLGAGILESLARRGLPARGGISGRAEKAADLPRALKEAAKAVEVAAAGATSGGLVWYEELGIFAWVDFDPGGLKNAAQRLLGPIIEYDRIHQLNLLETLALYYRHNCNLRKTAAAGYMSLSTVRYRLQRIRQISGLDLEDPETRLQLQLALKFLGQ